MRVVIYDEESLEPVTVVNLPGLSDKCLQERRHWRVAVPLPEPEEGIASGLDYVGSVQFIDLEFEQFSRVTLRHGEQLAWFCLTRAADLAMLLTPDWLPGQRITIEQLQLENERLAQLMITALKED